MVKKAAEVKEANGKVVSENGVPRKITKGQMVINYIQDNPGQTSEEIQEALGVSSSTVANAKRDMGLTKTRKRDRLLEPNPVQFQFDEDRTSAVIEAIEAAGGVDNLVKIVEAMKKAGGVDYVFAQVRFYQTMHYGLTGE